MKYPEYVNLDRPRVEQSCLGLRLGEWEMAANGYEVSF